MKIYKFGGASLKNVELVNKIFNIIKEEKNLIIVVSAIDKTTNALEKLIDAYFNNLDEKFSIYEKIKNFHLEYIKNCIGNNYNIVEIDKQFEILKEKIFSRTSNSYDFEYDAIVSFGEIFSSIIFFEYLKKNNLNVQFVDIRDTILTDTNHRDAKILWEDSADTVKSVFNENFDIYVTQGFIGRDKNREITTLGREGSDYTAAALGYLTDTESVTVWKDVPGIMNADPAWYKSAQKIDRLSFKEAVELAFYGAKIIHPKTIKPLENKNIPLFVKSFLNSEQEGTVVNNFEDSNVEMPPIFILKTNQMLISLRTKDFSFIVEENISKIFAIFAKFKIKVNIMQNSALSFTVSINEDSKNIDKLISELQNEYVVKYNKNMELLTIRYYTEAVVNETIENRKIFLEQRNRLTTNFVYEK
ncbi:MAG: aspartate kinase [Bacteroidales bacterium]|jgi:aspartate kinase|nr:aspartate kinase [Bacteroidales bacterium]